MRDSVSFSTVPNRSLRERTLYTEGDFIDTYKITTVDYFHRLQRPITGTTATSFLPQGFSDSDSESRNSDLWPAPSAAQPWGTDIQNAIVHGCLDFLVLKGYMSIHLKVGVGVEFRRTFKPCGSESDLENLPQRRS